MSGVLRPAVIQAPLRSSKPAVDINGFFQIVGDYLTQFIKTEGAPQGSAPTYEETFPKERLSEPDTAFDVILFHVIDGGMSPTSNDSDRTPRAPVGRQVKSLDEQTGYNQVTNGWWETYTVCFEIWSKTNSVANQLAVWFHRFLMRYAYYYGIFGAHGVQQFRFAGRLEDTVETRENQELYLRRLHYSVRLEFLDSFIERQLTDLTLNVRLDKDVLSLETPK